MRDPKLTFLIRCAYGAVWLALIWLMVRYVLVWLLPFLIALALAALLEPAVVLCRRRLHLRRGFTATVLSLVVLGTVAAGLVLLAMVLLRQVCELSGRLPGYLEALRRRCDEVGALLIFDEIQTGMGRTGELFAMLKYGVTPDIVCLAKALGGGMPLGAFVSSREIMGTLQENPVLGHITTFGGHPVCCAAGLAALNYLLDNGAVATVEAKGALYESLLADHPAVREIRRSGLLLAVELGEPAKLYRIMELFKEAGILSDWFLFCDTAFRISPPLTISDEEVRESAAIIRDCLDRV